MEISESVSAEAITKQSKRELNISWFILNYPDPISVHINDPWGVLVGGPAGC